MEALPRVRAEDHWLLQQSMLTKEKRREFVSAIPISTRDKVLDAGCGFGALAFDIALLKGGEVIGMDISVPRIELACWVNERLKSFTSVNLVEFKTSNVYDTKMPASSFDFVVARFLFQYLDKPIEALIEMKRMLKTGGHICIVGIDDQLVIAYPDMEPDVKNVYEQFRKLQRKQGGDRLVGRKLANYLHECGVEVIMSIVQPETHFMYLSNDNPAVQLDLERLCGAKNALIDNDLITGEQFEATIQKIRHSYPRHEWACNGQVIVLGRKKRTHQPPKQKPNYCSHTP